MKRKPIRRFTLRDGMILLAATALGLGWSRCYYQYTPGYPFPILSWVPPSQPARSPIVTMLPGGGWLKRVTPPPSPDGSTPKPMFVPVPLLNFDPYPKTPSAADWFRHWTQRPLVVIVPLLPLLVSWSFCLPVLIVAKERAAWRRAAGRPEVWVGIATAAVLVVRSLGFALYLASAGRLELWAPNRFESLADPAWIVLLRAYPFAAPTEIGWTVAAGWSALALTRRWRPGPGVMGWAGVALGSAWIAMIPIFYFWIGLPGWIP